MDAIQQKAHVARLGELVRKSGRNDHDEREALELLLALAADFLMDHKRQTELLADLIAGRTQEALDRTRASRDKHGF